MTLAIIKLNCNKIHDWDSFHDEFSRVFGFPEFYGRNMNAWIDCMSSLGDPDDGLSNTHCDKGQMLTLQLENAGDFKSRCPSQYEAIMECTAFVNWRLIENGEQQVLALAFSVL